MCCCSPSYTRDPNHPSAALHTTTTTHTTTETTDADGRVTAFVPVTDSTGHCVAVVRVKPTPPALRVSDDDMEEVRKTVRILGMAMEGARRDVGDKPAAEAMLGTCRTLFIYSSSSHFYHPHAAVRKHTSRATQTPKTSTKTHAGTSSFPN